MVSDKSTQMRVDLAVIAELVDEGARVLDLGCGDGVLLDHLINNKGASGFGVEISYEGVAACIHRGLPVFQGDIDQGLSDHQDHSFDFVILSHTLQTIRRPRFVIQEMLRVGRRTIVSFPNFGQWRVRRGLFLDGRMPRTRTFPYGWYETPNIRSCTLLDFEDLCASMGVRIVRRIPLTSGGHPLEGPIKSRFANLFAPMAVYLLEKSS